MTISRTIQGSGDDGYSFKLLIHSETSHGFVRSTFQFGIPWGAGQFEVLSSEERIRRFILEISRLMNCDATGFEYLSDEGNLEIKVKPYASGRVQITVLGIPNMAKNDRIEFEFEGLICETAGE